MENMKVHHVGYAVKKLEKAVEAFERLGYISGDITEDTSRNIRIVFMENGHERVELVTPNGVSTPVDGVLKNSGPTPYHICYEVSDMPAAVNELKANGWMVIKEPTPAPAIGDALVTFLYNWHVGMIELVEIK